MFYITVWAMQDGHRADLAHYVRTGSVGEMEDAVTRLHREFPAPGFRVDVTR
jgi:hypothetical protein